MTTLSNPLITGVATLEGTSGTSYYDRVRIGTGSPGYAGAAGTLYVGGISEFDAVVYFNEDISMAGNRRLVMADGSTTAWIMGTGSLAAPKRYLTFDTSDEQVEIGTKLEYEVASGIYNKALAGLDITATRQGEWFAYTLGSATGIGGPLSAPNPYSGTEGVLLDCYIKITGAASGNESHVNVGITSGASNVANIMKDVPVTATGTLFRGPTATSGGSGVSGRPVVWGTTNVLLVTGKGGTAVSSFAATLYAHVKQTD